jgi:uncharacterized membrane protein YfcA
MQLAPTLLLAALGVLGLWFVLRWWHIERTRRAAGQRHSRRASLDDCVAGFIVDFFDTLGIGNFAPTTAYLKLRGRVADENIPGTLNAGHSVAVVLEAFIFISAVAVDPLTLVTMIGAAAFGAWSGVGVVSRLPRRAIQVGMGVALLVAASLFVCSNTGLLPGGGDALGLHGAVLVFAVAVSYLLGALMMLGVGLYAPCLIMVSLLGMNPLAAFPIMMGSCAFLMPIGGERFMRAGRYDPSAVLALTIGGIPGVLVAAFIVKKLPLVWLRWLVVVVVVYAAVQMLRSAMRERRNAVTNS